MRRFVNADILHGQISDSTSLNRYSYVNGNPVSLIDPLGMIGERGSILYDGNMYDIYVPKPNENYLSGWTVVNTKQGSSEIERVFNWAKFITSLEVDDFNQVATGESVQPVAANDVAKACAASIGLGLLTSILNSCDVNQVFYQLQFLQKDDQRRVVFKVGSLESQNLYDKYADDSTRSFITSNMTNAGSMVTLSNIVEGIYESFTGEEIGKPFQVYDLCVTVDSAHKNDTYSSYLWVDADGTLMETPIIYKNDSAKIVQWSGFLWTGRKTILELPIDNAVPAPEYYQNLLLPALEIVK